MATYRLKSKIFGELDNLSSKKDEKKGFLGTGLSTGQVLLGTAAAVGGYKMAGRGMFGKTAQNSINQFRMNTSKVGSARYLKGKTGLDTNRTAELKQVGAWGREAGKTGQEIWKAKQAVYKKYDPLYGSGNSAAQYFN